jgi:NDP-sugar pyrophosphorylase family protein
MVPVGGRPIIDYLIEKIDTTGKFSEIFIVTNQKFSHVFEFWKNEKERDDIIIINDGTTAPENRL